MQPLTNLAIVIVGLPVAVFLLAMLLSDGAPLRPFAAGAESGPAGATQARAEWERRGGR